MSAAYDVVVVGGGINGVGVAQAVAAAGHSVLLVEKTALAAGTSSRSSKLIHGGLRYLESGELSLVRESLRERALLLRLAPDLVKLRPFFIPVYRSTRRRPWLIGAGLTLYALLGGFGKAVRYGTVPRSRWGDLDGLVTDDLDAVFEYADAQTDDALLTTAVMDSAISLGAELAVPARFVGADLADDGCEVRYTAGDPAHPRDLTCHARVLVNAAGPWVHGVLERITPAQDAVPIELVQGAHIEVAGRVARGIYYVESKRDGRAVFVMPWGERTLVGTTEVRFRGERPDDVDALRCEQIYLMRVLKRHFPRLAPRRREDILDAWAGIRVLPAGGGHAFHRSRETILATDQAGGVGPGGVGPGAVAAGARRSPGGAPPRLLTIYGGKLTTYRATAAKVMARIAVALPDRRPVADTSELPLQAR